MSNLPALPTYQRHKRVQAAMIVGINANSGDQGTDGSIVVSPNSFLGSEQVTIGVPAGFFARSVPAIGDYLIVYEDGYMSHSPAAAFEAGYSFVPPKEKHVVVSVYLNGQAGPRRITCTVSAAKEVKRWGCRADGADLHLTGVNGGMLAVPRHVVTMVEVGVPFEPAEG